MPLKLGSAGQQREEQYPVLHEYHTHINVHGAAAHVNHSDYLADVNSREMAKMKTNVLFKFIHLS